MISAFNTTVLMAVLSFVLAYNTFFIHLSVILKQNCLNILRPNALSHPGQYLLGHYLCKIKPSLANTRIEKVLDLHKRASFDHKLQFEK